MKRIFLLLAMVLAAALLPARLARADAAPPRSPSGSNVSPGQQTMVQMLAENVLLVIQKTTGGGYDAFVTADFRMRNQGQADESMQVRFPMEDVDGMGNGYGDKPLIRNFSAQADGTRLPTQAVMEPFQDGMPDVEWSTFPVTFPAGKDVSLEVSYEAGLAGEGSYQWLGYILETGAGWYGPIGSAVIIYRFPYAVGPVNVLADSGKAYLVGREVRFIASDFEPDSNSNTNLSFVDPAEWQTALDLESETGENPADVPSIVSLAETYEAMDYLHHDCSVNPGASQLAMSIVQEGLVYSPDSAALHAEWASLYFDRIECADFELSTEEITDPSWNEWVSGFSRELKLALALDPANEKALELQQEISQMLDRSPNLLATLTPAAIRTDTAGEPSFQPASTSYAASAPTQTLSPSGVPLLANASLETNGVSPSGITVQWVAAVGVGGIILGIGLAYAWKARKSKKDN